MGVKDSWQELFQFNDIPYDESVVNLRVDNSLVAMQMAAKGMGIALIYKSLCKEYLDDGKLVPAMKLEHHSGYSHYLILPEARLRPRPEVLLFRDWLRLESQNNSA